MDTDDLEPPVKADNAFSPLKLDDMSVDELEEYIGVLQAEIERVRQDIAAKQGHLTAAESVFKT